MSVDNSNESLLVHYCLWMTGSVIVTLSFTS